ncbi:DUF4908 domain-containing protein [Phenylobacterium sp.]|uniref:DUF4908 domain-containing protein n=1 Tax=Phenylobacterium sp. TaxID=1871053 RepID=UPI0025D0EBFD|nr:DUF4908 domain-containing protein [Phenylobacterium sp.]
MTASRRALSAALLCAAAFAATQPASAGVTDRLRDSLFRHRGGEPSGMPLARYVSEEGRAFVLDRTQPAPMIKFEDSPEVWVLVPSPAPRGDVVYRNDMGEPVLRATRLGGFTLFSDERPSGEAVSLAGAAQPLRMLALSPQALAERMLQASVRSGRAAHHPVVFEAEATPASAALIADAATLVSLAYLRLAGADGGRALLARVGKVQFMEGKKCSVAIVKDVMRIVVAPTQGLAGRPSSDRISKALRIGS